ncbi:MAG: DsbC family protein [Pseudomonadota bacterium]
MAYITRIATIVLLTSFPVFAQTNNDKASLEKVEAKLRALYSGTHIDRVTPSEVAGIYEVAMGKNIAYVDATGQYFLFGHLYDMRSQRDLTAERKESLAKIDFSTLPLQDAIKTVRGNGRRVVAVFSDPDCPYCKSLERETAKLTDATIYTFLCPIAELHPQAREHAAAIWCAADPADAWRAMMIEGKSPTTRECENPVERNIALAAKLGVNGTPTLIAGDGRVKAGAGNMQEIAAWLDHADKVALRGKEVP